MQIKRIDLSDDGRVYMIAYIGDKSPEMPYMDKRPAVVVCPGGAYYMTSDREAEPIALNYLARGFNAFVVRYSVYPHATFPNSLVDVSRAMKYIRDNAEEFGIYPDKIAVCGFSAGGHLAASIGTLWNDPEVQELAGCSGEENKPNALVLIYPVISSTRNVQPESIRHITIGIEDETKKVEALAKVSLENQVGKHTPPAFIAHTYSDNVVPVENPLLFASAMAAADVPFELHIFQNGGHGLALASHITFNNEYSIDEDFAKWIDLSAKWLYDTFGKNIPDGPYPRVTYENRCKGGIV
ncbi:MAG: alpha/beta hydrolase [Ruminococcaceae bacterium]|nr:alpha/beta hydrolase [Oscillospiraceae bacterium]